MNYRNKNKPHQQFQALDNQFQSSIHNIRIEDLHTNESSMNKSHNYKQISTKDKENIKQQNQYNIKTTMKSQVLNQEQTQSQAKYHQTLQPVLLNDSVFSTTYIQENNINNQNLDYDLIESENYNDDLGSSVLYQQQKGVNDYSSDYDQNQIDEPTESIHQYQNQFDSQNKVKMILQELGNNQEYDQSTYSYDDNSYQYLAELPMQLQAEKASTLFIELYVKIQIFATDSLNVSTQSKIQKQNEQELEKLVINQLQDNSIKSQGHSKESSQYHWNNENIVLRNDILHIKNCPTAIPVVTNPQSYLSNISDFLQQQQSQEGIQQQNISTIQPKFKRQSFSKVYDYQNQGLLHLEANTLENSTLNPNFINSQDAYESLRFNLQPIINTQRQFKNQPDQNQAGIHQQMISSDRLKILKDMKIDKIKFHPPQTLLKSYSLENLKRKFSNKKLKNLKVTQLEHLQSLTYFQNTISSLNKMIQRAQSQDRNGLADFGLKKSKSQLNIYQDNQCLKIKKRKSLGLLQPRKLINDLQEKKQIKKYDQRTIVNQNIQTMLEPQIIKSLNTNHSYKSQSKSPFKKSISLRSSNNNKSQFSHQFIQSYTNNQENLKFSENTQVFNEKPKSVKKSKKVVPKEEQNMQNKRTLETMPSQTKHKNQKCINISSNQSLPLKTGLKDINKHQSTKKLELLKKLNKTHKLDL